MPCYGCRRGSVDAVVDAVLCVRLLVWLLCGYTSVDAVANAVRVDACGLCSFFSRGIFLSPVRESGYCTCVLAHRAKPITDIESLLLHHAAGCKPPLPHIAAVPAACLVNQGTHSATQATSAPHQCGGRRGCFRRFSRKRLCVAGQRERILYVRPGASREACQSSKRIATKPLAQRTAP